jgi:hypothetical protein
MSRQSSSKVSQNLTRMGGASEASVRTRKGGVECSFTEWMHISWTILV